MRILKLPGGVTDGSVTAVTRQTLMDVAVVFEIWVPRVPSLVDATSFDASLFELAQVLPLDAGFAPRTVACRPRAATAATTPSAPIHLRRTPPTIELQCHPTILPALSLVPPTGEPAPSEAPEEAAPATGTPAAWAGVNVCEGIGRCGQAEAQPRGAITCTSLTLIGRCDLSSPGWKSGPARRDPEALQPRSGRAPHCAVRIGECPSTFRTRSRSEIARPTLWAKGDSRAPTRRTVRALHRRTAGAGQPPTFALPRPLAQAIGSRAPRCSVSRRFSR